MMTRSMRRVGVGAAYCSVSAPSQQQLQRFRLLLASGVFGLTMFSSHVSSRPDAQHS